MQWFDDLDEVEDAGGKGVVLAALYRRGFPVPPGFVVLPQAFDSGDRLGEGTRQAVRRAAEELSNQGYHRFAVRSSSLLEDGPARSHAGVFDSLLGVGEHRLESAIERVRASRHRPNQPEPAAEAQELAVVIQAMFEAQRSGVLFTADPNTGSRDAMLGEAVDGLSSGLTGGSVTPDAFLFRRPWGATEGDPGIGWWARRRLFSLARSLERVLDRPQDVEWAVRGRRVAILQSRPVSTLRRCDPDSGEWNDSFTGDYLWTNANVGEAVPGVMTPLTWSFLRILFEEELYSGLPDGYLMVGNIAGRLYLNVSLIASPPAAFGFDPDRVLRKGEDLIGRVPADLDVPLLPLTPWWVARHLVPIALRAGRRLRQGEGELPEFIRSTPQRCAVADAGLAAATTRASLLELWRGELEPLVRQAFRMLVVAMGLAKRPAIDLHQDLRDLVGEEDASFLLSSAGGHAEGGAGLLAGLDRVACGEWKREEFLRRFGHRGPEEIELQTPRPAEDPEWLDRELDRWVRSGVDLRALLDRRRRERAEALQRLRRVGGRRAGRLERRLDTVSEALHRREAARSEITRVLGVCRRFALSAGDATGLGDGAFLLSIRELLRVLEGNDGPREFLAGRRATDRRYRELPAYPALIRGRFDPFAWVDDPDRRADRFAATPARKRADEQGEALDPKRLRGLSASSGVVEGVVRVLNEPGGSEGLEAGEVLVTRTADIGWVPLFPRAVAVVTDVGAPLSHAAIVARELGIPAVVGCADAIRRLRTGQRVRVDGGAGTVELLT